MVSKRTSAKFVKKLRLKFKTPTSKQFTSDSAYVYILLRKNLVYGKNIRRS
jgi:hypothetical protein